MTFYQGPGAPLRRRARPLLWPPIGDDRGREINRADDDLVDHEARMRSALEAVRATRLPSSIAAHEASHALALVAFRTPIEIVAVGPDAEHPSWLGYCRGGAAGTHWASLVNSVIGEVADEHFFGRKPDPKSDDRRAALRSAGSCPGVDANDIRAVLRCVDDARGAALALIQANRSAVLRLGHELDRRREIGGADAA
jgi:hypothetical protein